MKFQEKRRPRSTRSWPENVEKWQKSNFLKTVESIENIHPSSFSVWNNIISGREKFICLKHRAQNFKSQISWNTVENNKNEDYNWRKPMKLTQVLYWSTKVRSFVQLEKALQVFPAETRLTVYRRLRVGEIFFNSFWTVMISFMTILSVRECIDWC